MKKSELKATLKPLIKECIKEVIFEEGVLSGIISEVMRGVGTPPLLIETPSQTSPEDTAKENRYAEMRKVHHEELKEQRAKLNEAVASRFGGADLFEGTTPISKAGKAGDPTAPSSPFQGIDPNDPGVDLSKLGIFGH